MTPLQSAIETRMEKLFEREQEARDALGHGESQELRDNLLELQLEAFEAIAELDEMKMVW